MSVTVTVDQTAFQAALKRHMASTSRELSEAINMRMASLLMRAFLILEPRDPQAKRNSVKSTLSEVVQDRTLGGASGIRRSQTKGRRKAAHFTRGMRILQFLRGRTGEPGLYGDAMRTEAGKFQRGRVASVGVVKSLVVRMLRGVMPAFTQFGGRTKKHAGRQVQPNALLVKLAREYGHSANNVGVSWKTRAETRKATPGINPTVQSFGRIKVDDGQEAAVQSRFDAALGKSFSDELVEMKRHLEAVVLDDAQSNGFKVT